MENTTKILSVAEFQAAALTELSTYLDELKNRFDLTFQFVTPDPSAADLLPTEKLVKMNVYLKTATGSKSKLASLSLGIVDRVKVRTSIADLKLIEKNIVESLPAFAVPDVSTIKAAPAVAAPAPKTPPKTYYNNGRNGTIRATFGSPEADANYKMQNRVGDAIANATKRDIPAGIVAQFYNGDIALEDLEKAIGASPTFKPTIGPQIKRK